MEWEYAARGGNRSKDYKFSGSDRLDEVGWYEENMEGMTGPRPVGLKKSNKLGIYDMSGNVWEWCEDLYGSYSSGNPTGPDSGSCRVFRGGCCYNGERNCRSSNRSDCWPVLRDFNLGFRLALSE